MAASVTPAGELARLVGGPSQFGAIVERLAQRPGTWVTRDQLVDWIWSEDPDGGPLSAPNQVSVLICRFGPRLARHGWRIESGEKLGLGRRLGYRLVMLAAAG